jgi:hypothetical protein
VPVTGKKKKRALPSGARALKLLQPFLGRWSASAPGYTVTRELSSVLGGKYLQLAVHWDLGSRQYEEHAVYGVDLADKQLKFWSFTSDGKRSEGKLVLADAGVVTFEAKVGGGLGRMSLHSRKDGFTFTVDAQPKGAKSWKRFLEQHFTPREA